MAFKLRRKVLTARLAALSFQRSTVAALAALAPRARTCGTPGRAVPRVSSRSASPRLSLAPCSESTSQVSAIQDRIGALRAQIEDLRRTRADALRDVSGADAQSDVHDTVLESARTIDQSIRSLERGPQAGASMRSQVELLRARLLEALREYHAMEREARAGARARIERQLRIGAFLSCHGEALAFISWRASKSRGYA